MSSGLTPNPINTTEEIVVSPQGNALIHILHDEKDSSQKPVETNVSVTVELTYTDFLRFKKLIEKDEALRQRSRDKAKQGNTKPTRSRKQYIEPIKYKLVNTQISPND